MQIDQSQELDVNKSEFYWGKYRWWVSMNEIILSGSKPTLIMPLPDASKSRVCNESDTVGTHVVIRFK